MKKIIIGSLTLFMLVLLTGCEKKYSITKEEAKESDTYKGIVYLDPTDLTKQCNASNSVSTTETKEGCMRWYIYDDSRDTYKMILDHNTTAKVVWNSLNTNENMEEVKTALLNDTNNWDEKLNVSLISAEEVAKIVNNKSFDNSNHHTWFYFDSEDQEQSASTLNKSKYAWLFDNTYSCESNGCNISDFSTYGYWTSSKIVGYESSVWTVFYYGNLYYDDANINNYGIRPVIEVSKNLFN